MGCFICGDTPLVNLREVSFDKQIDETLWVGINTLVCAECRDWAELHRFRLTDVDIAQRLRSYRYVQ